MNSTSYRVAYNTLTLHVAENIAELFNFTPYLECKLRTHFVIHESFLLYFIPRIVARLEEDEALYFTKSSSDSGSLKSRMLPSSLPLPASFFKVFPRFHKNLIAFTTSASTSTPLVNRAACLTV